MATAGWTTHAILQSSAGGKEWKIEINQEGTLRCNCPSYIFCKQKPRACKHTRHCALALLNEKAHAAGQVSTSEAEALRICRDMCEAAGPTMWDHIGNVGIHRMAGVLAARLDTWQPRVQVTATAALAVGGGVRRIVFDD